MKKLIFSIFLLCEINNCFAAEVDSGASAKRRGKKNKGAQASVAQLSIEKVDSIKLDSAIDASAIDSSSDNHSSAAGFEESAKPKLGLNNSISKDKNMELLSVFKVVNLVESVEVGQSARKYVFVFLDPFADCDQVEDLTPALKQYSMNISDQNFVTIVFVDSISLKKASVSNDATKSFIDNILSKAFVILLTQNDFSKERDNILLIGFGYGGCIASALTNILATSNSDLIADFNLVCVAMPVLFPTEEQVEGCFGGVNKKDSPLYLGKTDVHALDKQTLFFPKGYGIKVLNLYSNADHTQLGYGDHRRKIIFGPETLAKLDSNFLNIRVFIDTVEPVYQDLCRVVTCYLNELEEAFKKCIIYTDCQAIIVKDQFYSLQKLKVSNPVLMIIRWDETLRMLFYLSENRDAAAEMGKIVYDEFETNEANKAILRQLYPDFNFYDQQSRMTLFTGGAMGLASRLLGSKKA